MTQHTGNVTFKAPNGTGWNALQDQLETAHAAVRSLAIPDRRHGILVTRRGHGTYTVALSAEVPYGLTYERDDAGVP